MSRPPCSQPVSPRAHRAPACYLGGLRAIVRPVSLVYSLLPAVVFLLLALLPRLPALAARLEKPGETIHLVASPERGLSLRKPERAVVSISGFKREEARKFLLLALGPETFDKEYNSGSSFFGAIPDDKCVVKNTLLPEALPFERRSAEFAAQTRALRSCVVTRVVNAAGMPLRIPGGQPGCTVEAQSSPSEAVLSGGYCFVGIGIEAAFFVTYEVRPECRSQAFLDLQGLEPRDFFAFSGFFVSGDASGTSLDLTPIDSVSLRYTHEAPAGPVPQSMDLGPTEPRYPALIEPRVEMGRLRVLDLGDKGASLEASFHVANTCEVRCARGRCVNPCSFPAALGAQVTLVDTTIGQPVHSAFAGGVAPPIWEGLLPFQTKVAPQLLVPGHRYSFEADFAYPDQYYQVFKDGFSQFLVDVGQVDRLASSAGTGVLPALRPLTPMGSLADIPLLPPLQGLLGGASVSVGGALESLNRLVKFAGWPPFYESVCAKGACVDVRKGRHRLIVGAEFTIDSFQDGTAVLKDIVHVRRSALFGNARQALSELPAVVCDDTFDPF